MAGKTVEIYRTQAGWWSVVDKRYSFLGEHPMTKNAAMQEANSRYPGHNIDVVKREETHP